MAKAYKKDRQLKIEENRAKDFDSLLVQLRERLQEKGMVLRGFTPDRKTSLPPYNIMKDGEIVGFADVIHGKLEEYNRVSAAAFRNGAFCQEMFGIPKKGDEKGILRMRYVVFLIDWDSFYFFNFKGDRGKPYPTLEENGTVNVCIHRREFEAL